MGSEVTDLLLAQETKETNQQIQENKTGGGKHEKFIFEAKKEYHLNREKLEADMNDEEFMAIYEELEKLNDLGDDFLDEHQEKTTPAIAKYVMENIEKF